MTVSTVGELRKALEAYPDDMALVGYNGSDGEPLIAVLEMKKEDDMPAEENNRRPYIVINLG